MSGILGYSRLWGGYPGNQAEYCRVPNADLTGMIPININEHPDVG